MSPIIAPFYRRVQGSGEQKQLQKREELGAGHARRRSVDLLLL